MPRHSPERIEEQIKALEARQTCANYRQMARLLGCSTTKAWELIQEAMAAAVKEPTDVVRELELSRLDQLYHAGLKRAITEGPGQPRAMEVLLKVMERRAALEGLDAPRRRVLEITTPGELERLIPELEAQIVALDGDGVVEGELVEA